MQFDTRKNRIPTSRAIFDTGPAADFNPHTLHARQNGSFRGFRRDSKDRVQARESVTGRLLGDPPAGKFDHPPLWTSHREDRFADPYHGMGAA